ncbi:transcription antitermination factor NusB [Hydrogenobaculum acidophilum]
MKEIRAKARELAIRILYAWDINGGDIKNISEEIVNMEEEPTQKDTKKYTRLIITKFEENVESVDKKIASYLENWNFDDLGSVEKAVLRASFSEFLYIKPAKYIQAIIDYVDISNKYGNKKTPSFINGILSKLVKDIYTNV